MGGPHRDLVGTDRAAQALGIAPSTLYRWHHDPTIAIEADWVTPGKHLRWDVDRLRRALSTISSPTVPEAVHVPEPATRPEHQPVAAAVVVSHLGVLAGRRHDGKPPWTFIAGEVEPGESAADAATREVKEETGLEVRAGHHEIGRRVHPKTGRTMIYLACTPAAGTDVFVGDVDELAEVRWLALAEVDDLMPGMFEPVREHLGRMLT